MVQPFVTNHRRVTFILPASTLIFVLIILFAILLSVAKGKKCRNNERLWNKFAFRSCTDGEPVGFAFPIARPSVWCNIFVYTDVYP